MSEKCVYCDKPKERHRAASGACPVWANGHRVGWHPTNRFTPAGEQFSEQPEQERAIGGTTYCKVCGEENYPDDCCTCKSPATVQPEHLVLERYHIEPSGKMWVEHPPFKESTPQPAGVEGETCAACRGTGLFDYDDGKGARQCLNCNGTGIFGKQQPACPKCAELERSLSVLLDPTCKDANLLLNSVRALKVRFAQTYESHQRLEAKAAELGRERDAWKQRAERMKLGNECFERERDALKAKCEQLEKALSESVEALENVNRHCGLLGGERARLESAKEVLASAALAGGKEADSGDSNVGTGKESLK